MQRILVINPGSTSTKSAVYEDKKCIADQSIAHTKEELDQNSTTEKQVVLRKNCIMDWLGGLGLEITDIDAFAVRGCNIEGCNSGGTYLVNEKLAKTIMDKHDPEAVTPHASRLALPIALRLSEADDSNKPIFITDPPCVNELSDIAKVSGHPLFTRESVFHALNTKAVGYRAAEELNKTYNKCKFVIVHMGGGISVSAHNLGRVTEANDCIAGGGPFSPNRTGTLPVVPLVELCFSEKYSKKEIIRMIKNEGGLLAHLGTADVREVEKMIEAGDEKSQMIYNAMAYQIAKEVGSCFVSLSCEVDAIIFTGGMAHSKRLMEILKSYIEKLGKVKIMPGEYENEALAYGALRVLQNKVQPILL